MTWTDLLNAGEKTHYRKTILHIRKRIHKVKVIHNNKTQKIGMLINQYGTFKQVVGSIRDLCEFLEQLNINGVNPLISELKSSVQWACHEPNKTFYVKGKPLHTNVNSEHMDKTIRELHTLLDHYSEYNQDLLPWPLPEDENLGIEDHFQNNFNI
jgi:hypothetical protein